MGNKKTQNTINFTDSIQNIVFLSNIYYLRNIIKIQIETI